MWRKRSRLGYNIKTPREMLKWRILSGHTRFVVDTRIVVLESHVKRKSRFETCSAINLVVVLVRKLERQSVDRVFEVLQFPATHERENVRSSLEDICKSLTV